MLESVPMGDDVLSVELKFLRGDVVEMKSALNRMTDAVTKLALVEQQQSQIALALERAFKSIENTTNRFDEITVGLDARIAKLEVSQPKHSETAKWVDRGLLALAGVGGTVLAKASGIL